MLTEALPAQDVVSLQDYEDAIDLLNGESVWVPEPFGLGPPKHLSGDPGPIGKVWLERAVGHLHVKVDRYFRDRPPLRDEKQFLAYLKTMAQGYREGAQALEWAAKRLKDSHQDSHGANVTHKAAIGMARAAQELIGEQ